MTSRDELLSEYIRLVREVLPLRARREGWVVSEDHCFGRVVLDGVCGGPWREHLTGRGAAFRQLSNEQLHEAVELLRRIERDGDEALRPLNRQSLEWRGKV